MSRNTLAFALLWVSGCVSPSDGQFLCREAPYACPSGMQCDDGICRTQLAERDADALTPDTFTPSDANTPDARSTDVSDAFRPDARGLPPTRAELCAAADAQCLDFETSILDGWSFVAVASAGAEIGSGGYMSERSLGATATRGTAAIRYNSPGWGSSVYVSARVNVSRMGDPMESNATLFALSNDSMGATTRTISLGQFTDPTAVGELQQVARLTLTDDDGSMTAEANPFYLDDWRCLELLVENRGGTSTASGWVDGIPTGPRPGPSLDLLSVLDIGLATTSTTAVTVRIDDVYVGRERVGCLPTP